jgi:hypothetical protein
VEKALKRPRDREPKRRAGLLIQTARNLLAWLRVVVHFQQRIAVVGNGNIDVGNQTPTRKPGQPVVERLAGSDSSSELRIDKPNPPKTERPQNCGAMSEQGGDSGRGSVSAPQKFVQLVGYRDPKVRHEPWVRPGPVPAKR